MKPSLRTEIERLRQAIRAREQRKATGPPSSELERLRLALVDAADAPSRELVRAAAEAAGLTQEVAIAEDLVRLGLTENSPAFQALVAEVEAMTDEELRALAAADNPASDPPAVT